MKCGQPHPHMLSSLPLRCSRGDLLQKISPLLCRAVTLWLSSASYLLHRALVALLLELLHQGELRPRTEPQLLQPVALVSGGLRGDWGGGNVGGNGGAWCYPRRLRLLVVA